MRKAVGFILRSFVNQMVRLITEWQVKRHAVGLAQLGHIDGEKSPLRGHRLFVRGPNREGILQGFRWSITTVGSLTETAKSGFGADCPHLPKACFVVALEDRARLY